MIHSPETLTLIQREIAICRKASDALRSQGKIDSARIGELVLEHFERVLVMMERDNEEAVSRYASEMGQNETPVETNEAK